MVSVWIIVLLTLLCAADIVLLCVLAYSARGQKNRANKAAFGFMAAVLVMNVLFSVGGVVVW